jgi:hypothetical protein
LFASRIGLVGSNVVASGYNIAATAEPGEPSHSGFGGASNSVWWAWSPPRSGIARLNAQGTTYIPSIAIYNGSTLAGLTPVASLFSATHVDFTVTGGVSYVIAFDGWFGSMGNIQFALGMLNPVINLPALAPGGIFQFTLAGVPGVTCVLQTSTNLTIWLPVSTNTLPPGGMMTLTNYPLPNERARFYRILAE